MEHTRVIQLFKLFNFNIISLVFHNAPVQIRSSQGIHVYTFLMKAFFTNGYYILIDIGCAETH